MPDSYCSSEACDIFLNNIIPAFGTVLALGIFFSPWKAVQDIKKSKRLGGINPIPYPMLVNNCIGWVLYGFLIRNYWIAVPNIIGFFTALYYTMIGMMFASNKQVKTMLLLLYSGLFLAFIGATISFITLADTIPYGEKGPSPPQSLLLGSVTVVNLICFYMSPLSTLYRVIASRNSISFSWRLSLSSFLNGLMWAIYGSFIGDLFVAIPNGAGVILAGLQLICIWVFPSSEEGSRLPGVHDSDSEDMVV